MLYCGKCKSITKDTMCPFCGNKKIREIRENDAVYLTTVQFPFSGMLEEVLKENEIPCLKQSAYGAITLLMTSGLKVEEYKFYVPFGAYKKAKELLEELFGEEDSQN